MSEKYRLRSLDIFRGITVAAMILVNTPGNGANVYAPLEHSKWNGCTPTDLVFPCFLFMVGISIVYALKNRRSETAGHPRVLLAAFRRMLLIIGIGLGIQLFYHFDFATLRYPGVLQRIGVVYFICTLLYLKCSDKALAGVFAFSLIAYYLLMVFAPAPGGRVTDLQPETNLAAYIDRYVFTLKHMKKDTRGWDPLGLLSTLPAIGSTLYGVFAGLLLNRSDQSGERRTVLLFASGTISVLAGLAWNLFFPINKPLWSSSYVLYAAGICTLGFAFTYWFTDIERRGKALWPFLVFGKNAITAYVVSEILPGLLDYFHYRNGEKTLSGMDFLYEVFLSFLAPRNASLLAAVCFVAFVWLMMYPLYRRNLFLKL